MTESEYRSQLEAVADMADEQIDRYEHQLSKIREVLRAQERRAESIRQTGRKNLDLTRKSGKPKHKRLRALSERSGG